MNILWNKSEKPGQWILYIMLYINYYYAYKWQIQKVWKGVWFPLVVDTRCWGLGCSPQLLKRF